MGGHGEYCERPEEIRPALVNVKLRQDLTTGMKGSKYV